MIDYYAAAGILAFVVTLVLTALLIPRLRKVGITGKDENKKGAPDIPEMGGIAIVAGLSAGMLLAIFFNTFLFFEMNLIYLLAAILTVYIVAAIGIIDDLLHVPQWLKAILPLFAAIPLVAVKAAGSTAMFLPFIGMVDFGIIYIVVLIPIGIAVSSNLTNMLAGFNGMEAGMGAVIFLTMLVLGLANNSVEMSVISVSMLGALLAFLIFNRFPAKVFPGDVGNLTIGAALAAAVIIGSFETAGAIIVIPYVMDFFIKLVNGLPHTRQALRNEKLYPKDGKIKGLVHVVMRIFGGIKEKNLVSFFIAVEVIFAIIVLLVHLMT
jgi:UDP-N-acetylglucosamine--dolichyl-phosphate N-acetylglucosaminephosphotransferase